VSISELVLLKSCRPDLGNVTGMPILLNLQLASGFLLHGQHTAHYYCSSQNSHSTEYSQLTRLSASCQHVLSSPQTPQLTDVPHDTHTQCLANLLHNCVHQANPVSPGSPFSAKQRKWSGIVQQVQDSSARLHLRRRQSTEAAAAGTSLLLHMQPSSIAQRTGAAAPGLHSMRSQFAAPKGSLAKRAAAEAAPGSVHQQAGARNCSDSSSNCPLQTPAARDKVGPRSTM
jgi:hypothetical protein